MEGLNIWGICTFVMPLVLVIIIGLMMIIVSTVEGLNKLIKKQEVLMENLREQLYKAIEKYGIGDERTIAISEELNKFICRAQKQYC